MPPPRRSRSRSRAASSALVGPALRLRSRFGRCLTMRDTSSCMHRFRIDWLSIPLSPSRRFTRPIVADNLETSMRIGPFSRGRAMGDAPSFCAHHGRSKRPRVQRSSARFATAKTLALILCCVSTDTLPIASYSVASSMYRAELPLQEIDRRPAIDQGSLASSPLPPCIKTNSRSRTSCR